MTNGKYEMQFIQIQPWIKFFSTIRLLRTKQSLIELVVNNLNTLAQYAKSERLVRSRLA